MQHKLYNLDSKQTILGIDLSDIMVGITTWMLGNFLAGEFLPPRLQMLTVVVTMASALTLWRAFKDKLPPGFFRHFLSWATEANAYRIGPDTKARPAVVDHRRVLGLLETEKRDRSRISRMPPKLSPGTLTDVRPNLSHAVRLTPPPQSAPMEAAKDDPPTPKVSVGHAEQPKV